MSSTMKMQMQKYTAGFTLIELLITVSIILLLTGTGIAGFVNFNDRQQVQTTAKSLETLMRSAQVKARSGEGASDCNPATPEKLKGYQVALTAPDTVVLNRVCADPQDPAVVTSVTPRQESSFENIEITLTPDTASDVTFLALHGGIDLSGEASITFTVTGEFSDVAYSFQVLDTGEITQGDFVQ